MRMVGADIAEHAESVTNMKNLQRMMIMMSELKPCPFCGHVPGCLVVKEDFAEYVKGERWFLLSLSGSFCKPLLMLLKMDLLFMMIRLINYYRY